MAGKKNKAGWYGETRSGRADEEQGEGGGPRPQADGSSRDLPGRGAQPPSRQGSSKQRGGITQAAKKKSSTARSKNSSSR